MVFAAPVFCEPLPVFCKPLPVFCEPLEPPLTGTAARLHSTMPITNIEKTTMPVIIEENPVVITLLTVMKVPCFDNL